MNETVDPDQIEVAHPATTTPAPQRPAPKGHRWGRLALALALAAVVVVGWQYVENIAPSNNQGGRPSGPPPQTVRAAPAFKGDMPVTIDSLGAVTPFATVTIKTQIAGKLMQVGFKEGQMVKEGDFLIQIDPRPYEAALALAQAQLAKDTALHQQAQADLARFETLNKQDSIARQQVEDQVFLVAQDKAAMDSDQANIDTAKLNIAYCHIVSPINGRIGLRLVDPGNYVQPSDASGLVVITEIDPISVVFSTPEDNLPAITARLNSGATLAATAFDRANVKQIATGTLTTFDNQVDVTTGTFKLRATFANPNGVLFPNQFVNVRLLVDTISGAVLAPNAAVQLGANGSFVYVVNENSTVSVRQVTTGPSDAQNTVIASGLAVGENVVIDGVDRLRDGAKVSVRNNANAAAQTPPTGSGAGQGQHRHRRDGQAPGGAATPANGSQ
ncbi:MAG TPA: efflux RND transporter periplasmic adaptor subunit [Roseiarcus sp.]